MEAENVVKAEIAKYEAEEQQLQTLVQELSTNPKFAQFLEAQKAFNELSANVWKRVEQEMIDNNITHIETDKVKLTIAQRASFDIDTDTLPAKFFKRVPDTTKINGTFKLEGKAPKGCTPKFTRYLVRRIK